MSTGIVFANEMSERFYKSLNQPGIGINCLPSSFKYPGIHEDSIIKYLMSITEMMPFLKNMGINENTYSDIFQIVSKRVCDKYITKYESYAKTQLMKTKEMFKEAFMTWYKDIVATNPGMPLNELAMKFEQQYETFATDYGTRYLEMCDISRTITIDFEQEMTKEVDSYVESKKLEYIKQFDFYLLPLIDSIVEERMKKFTEEYEQKMKATKKKPIESKPTNENKYKLMLCVNYDTKNIIDTKIMITKNENLMKSFKSIQELVPNVQLMEYRPSHFLIDDVRNCITIRVITPDYKNEPWKYTFISDDISNLHWRVSLSNPSFITAPHKAIMAPLTTCAQIFADNITEYNISYEGIFANCSRLSIIDKPKYDTLNVVSFKNMFNGCSTMKTIDISNWKTNNVNNVSGLCQNCSNLVSFKAGKLCNANDYSHAFDNCQSLQTVDISKWEPKIETNLSYMFNNCLNLKTLDVSTWPEHLKGQLKNGNSAKCPAFW